MSEQREQIEKSADRIRGEFEKTLGELDRRRHAALDIGAQVRQRAAPLAITGGTLVALVAAGITIGVIRRRRAEKQLSRRRLQVLRTAWRRPERVTQPAPKNPWVEAATKIGISLGSTVAIAWAKHAMKQWMPETETEQ